MIAHIGPFPLEELLLALAGGGGAALVAARVRLRALVHRRRPHD